MKMQRQLTTFLKIFPILFLFITSCSNRIETTINGLWSIDTIYYMNFDARVCFLSNIIAFEDNEIIKLPTISEFCSSEIIYSTEEKNENWKIIRTTNPEDSIPLRIEIISKNKTFVGLHDIVFHKDEQNKLLKMEISSDSLYIVCRKGLFDYDLNIELIEELEKTSKKRVKEK